MRPVPSLLAGLILVACAMTSPAASAQDRITAPGWAWGRFSHPEPVERKGQGRLVHDLIVEQGFRFHAAPFGLEPEIFVRLDLKADNQNHDHDNRARMMAGLRAGYPLADGLRIHAGWRLGHEHRWQSAQNAAGATLFAGWSGWWALSPQQMQQTARLSLSTWGEAVSSYSLASNERDNSVLEGAVQMDARLTALSPQASLIGRLMVEASADTERRSYRSWIRPSLGLHLEYRLSERVSMEAGGRTAIEWQKGSDNPERGASVFVVFKASWDDLPMGKTR